MTTGHGQVAGDDLGRLAGRGPWARSTTRSVTNPWSARKRPSRSSLALALVGQRPLASGPGPGVRVAGMGVAQEVRGASGRLRSTAAGRATANCWTRSPSWMKTLPEGRQALLLRALDGGRVLVAPVERLVDAGEDRADLAGLVAHRDDVVERSGRGTRRPTWSAPTSASMPGLGQDPQGQRVDALRARSRRCGPRSGRRRGGAGAPRP